MAEIPKAMKAWVVVKNGSPREALELRTDWPTPVVEIDTDVLIKLTHATVNPADVHYIEHLPLWIPFRRQPIPGIDFAGVVVQKGDNVKPDIEVGSEVCGALGIAQIAFGQGTWCEYIRVPSHLIILKPKTLTMAQAAAMGVSGQTANEMFVRLNPIKSGDKILLIGASGGVGSTFLQLAKTTGVTVHAVCSGANAELVRRLGADEVIDYTKLASLPSYLQETYQDAPFDKIFDCVGVTELFEIFPTFMNSEGDYVNVVGYGSDGKFPLVRKAVLPVVLGGSHRNFRTVVLSPSGKAQESVAEWIEEGNIKEVLIDSDYPMEEMVQACERVLSRRSRGRVVIRFDS